MRLGDLLQSIANVRCEPRFNDLLVAMISCDSREPQGNAVFVALSGEKFNGADFIREAISKGALAIAKTGAGRQIGEYLVPQNIAVIEVKDTQGFLRQAAERFYGQPSSRVKTIGITGTNGKTTITYLLESIIQAAGKTCGVIGTVNHRIGDQILPSKNTTPGYLDNQRYLAQLLNLNADFCVMEVSSHALHQRRVDGIDFAAAIFTNLTQDHLDYHKDMESYFKAKSLLFTRLSGQAASLINTDDSYGRRLMLLSQGKTLSFGIDRPAGVMARNIDYRLSGTTFELTFPDGKIQIHTHLIGKHNVYNILAAAACVYELGFLPVVIKQGIERLKNVPGRLEAVDSDREFFVFIDYAHTEDGLLNVLKALRAVSSNRIVVVFGCGGDRDAGKRPKMGRAVCELADYAIVTSDNPRSEDPQAIIDQIIAGFIKNNYEVCIDRREAIGRALHSGRKGDIVLLAGKGHETYQVLKDKTIPFNEREIAGEFLKSVHN